MNAVFLVFQLFVVLLLLLLTLFSFLLIRKYRSNRFEEKLNFWKQHYLESLNGALKWGKELKSPETKAMFRALEEVLSGYYSFMKGNTSMIAGIETIAEDYFKETYQKQLESSKWTTRMNTLYRVEKFRMLSLVDASLRIYRKKDVSEMESIQVLRILANLQDDRIYTILLHETRDFSGFYYLDLFSRLEGALFHQFVESIDQFPTKVQHTLIEAMGERKEYDYLPYIEAFLFAEEAEFRIRALKALAKIGYVSKLARIIPSFTAENWEERMAAAKAVRKLRDTRLVDLLLPLLSDSSWWVRSAAAESLFYQHRGEELLEEVVRSHSDRFARDIAHEWLLRKEFKRVAR